MALRNIDVPDPRYPFGTPQAGGLSVEERMIWLAKKFRSASEHHRSQGALGTPIRLKAAVECTTFEAGPMGQGWRRPLAGFTESTERQQEAVPILDSGTQPLSPFDELFASVTAPFGSAETGRSIDAPPSRFMVRVAAVEQPHRTTKRDYDYFKELNAALAERNGRSSGVPGN
jgi:hypothetical protein